MTAQLKRSLSLVQLVFYGVGTIVGAGIYSVFGAAAGEAGGFVWVSFVLAGVTALLTVLSYAELSSMYPKAGAEYQYLRNALPGWPVACFMAGCIICLNASATAATVALAFAGYLRTFVELPAFVIAYVLLALCTVVNIMGIRQATWLSIGFICIEVSGLLFVIFAGLSHGDLSRNWAGGAEAFSPDAIVAATALVFFTYIGFEDMANLSEEAKKPQRDIPRALLLSVIITTVLYLLVAFSAIGLMEPAALSKSEAPLSEAVETAIKGGGKALAVAALFATASTALITMVAISRLLFSMARDRFLPNPLSRLLPGRQTPWVAALVLFASAGLLVPLGEVKIIASISSFGILLIFISVQSAVIILRHIHPRKARGFSVPCSIGRWPLPCLLGIGMALALLTQFEMKVYAVGCGVIGVAAAVYAVWRRPGK